MTHNLPDNSIKGAGGLEPYINRFFIRNGIDKNYSDFLDLLKYQKIPKATRARELGIAKNTFNNWVNLYEATHKG